VGALHGVDGHFDFHFGIGSQERRRYGIPPGTSSDTLGNDRLICRDVVRGHMLDGDLLLAATAMMVEPFGQQHHRPRRLVGELTIS